MADLSADYTGRLRVKYAVAGAQHSLGVRYSGDGPPDPAVVNKVGQFLVALQPILYNTFQIVAIEYMVKGSNVALPLAATITVAGGGPAGAIGDRPKFISFSGKAATGKKVRIVVFGAAFEAGGSTVSGDYRLYETEQAIVDNALTILDNATEFVAPDGSAGLYWHRYANFGVNSYWQRSLRG